MKRITMVTFAAVATMSLAVFGACKNGPNNARDTTGMTNSSAAGSLGDTAKPRATTDTSAKRPDTSAKAKPDTTKRP